MKSAGTKLKNRMRAAVAMEPVIETSPSLNLFEGTIRQFQIRGFLPSVRIISIVHAGLYLVPRSWYAENEERYVAEARQNIETTCLDMFEFDSVQVLKGTASTNQYLVEKMSENLRRTGTDLLVVLSNNRTGVPHWFLGSFAETAALAATCSVLVIKPHVKGLEFSSKPSLTVALDASSRYTSKHIKWIADFALPARARIDLVCVKPGSKEVFSHLRKPRDPKLAISEIKKFDRALKRSGLTTTLSFIRERGSIAETISAFADRRKSSAVLTIATDRKAARRILIGSTARRVLTLTKRPFISLRLA